MGVKDISKTMTLKDGVSGTLNKISAGTVQYKKHLRELQEVGSKTWSTMRSGLSSITASAAGAASAILGVVGVSSAIGFATNTASDLESYRLTLETVLKDTKKAGELMQWASKFANITPFDTKEVIEGTVRLQSYGINAQTTMRSIGDMAAVMNKDLMQAIEAVADAQTGELERMKEFGITKGMIQKKSDQMFHNQTVINNKGQIVDQQRFNQALFALMDQRFKGGMEKQSHTFKGLMSTITGTWQTGLAEIMGINTAGEIRDGSLFAKLKKSAESLANTVTQMSENGSFRRIGDGLANILKTTTSIFNFIKENWTYISPVVYGIAAAFVAYKAALIGVRLWTMATAAATWVMTAAQLGLGAAMRANPIGVVITLLGLLVAAGTYVIHNWEQVKLAGMNTWNVVVGAAEWGANAFIKYANFSIRVYKFAFDSIEFAGKSIWNGIIMAGQAGVNGFIRLIEFMVQKSADGINKLIRGINKVSGNLGLGTMDELSFSGLGRVDFSGAMANPDKPKWDNEFNPIPTANFNGAKFSDDSIMKQTQKAQAERDKRKAKSEDNLAQALKQNAAALADNTSATGANTGATNKNTAAVLKENKTPLDIADSLLSRIERHLYAT